MVEEIKRNVTDLFWTDMDEMVAELKNNGYSIEEANEEYVVIRDVNENGYACYLGHANSTMWIGHIEEE